MLSCTHLHYCVISFVFPYCSMQLFTIGLNVLNDDGQAVTDSNGNPLQTYTNEDIESYAR